MISKEDIKRRKIYYKGLKDAIAMPWPEEGRKRVEEIKGYDWVTDDMKQTLRLWMEVVGPVDRSVAYIYNNRFVPLERNNIINDDTMESPIMSGDEIFEVLSILILPAVMDYLSVLTTTSVVKENLLKMVEKRDKDGFVTLLDNDWCDTTPLAKLCACCMDDVQAGYAIGTSGKDEVEFYYDKLFDNLQKVDPDDEEYKHSMERVTAMHEEIMNDDDLDTIESLRGFFESWRDFLEKELADELHYYWNYYDKFLPKEKALIEAVLENPLAEELVDRIWEEYLARLNGKDFTLPDDFFEMKFEGCESDYFFLKAGVEKQGAETFAEFINYVAENGYIDNDPDTKALFAYRFSGRCRPDGELPPIEWHGKNGKSYELIYLVRSLSDRGDYKKMRCFFTGPEWVKNRDCSYSDSANSNFRLGMTRIYPNVCYFKKK